MLPTVAAAWYCSRNTCREISFAGFLQCLLPFVCAAVLHQQLTSCCAVLFLSQAPGLPKTRSGKIMRRVLRKIAAKQEDELGDVSTLADPNVVEQLVSLRGH